MFNNGKLKIRCSASIFNVYHRSEERSIEYDKRNHKYAVALHGSTTTDFPTREYNLVQDLNRKFNKQYPKAENSNFINGFIHKTTKSCN